MTLVVAAIVRSRRTVLLAQRPLGEPLGPRWEFSGGKVEPGEAPEASLQRESTPTVHRVLAWAAPEDVTSFDPLPADVPITQALADADP